MNDRILFTTSFFAVVVVLLGITGCKKKVQIEEPQTPVQAAPQINPGDAKSAQSNLTSCPLVPNSPLFTEG